MTDYKGFWIDKNKLLDWDDNQEEVIITYSYSVWNHQPKKHNSILICISITLIVLGVFVSTLNEGAAAIMIVIGFAGLIIATNRATFHYRSLSSLANAKKYVDYLNRSNDD